MPHAFPLGSVVMTPGVMSAFGGHFGWLLQCLDKHVHKDWGVVCDEDKEANEQALKDGDRLLSKYVMEGVGSIYVITEADRSSTTVLLPEEY